MSIELEKRLSGQLPEISIDGKSYTIDWSKKELRAVNDPAKRIDLAKLDMNSDGTAYVCFYDRKQELVVHPGEQKRDTHNLCVLSIPYELKLDPVGVAWEYGIKESELLGKFPIQKELSAKITPVNKIAQNKKKQQTKKRGKRI